MEILWKLFSFLSFQFTTDVKFMTIDYIKLSELMFLSNIFKDFGIVNVILSFLALS